ncbi:hypothetical protein ACVOMV_26155 (plasmid) [Mesorhizobium atlanticum]|uniref:hypothetical protein n=1 Tax=Mesorhizobium atlanticum TaxID=2233532 RepID=UPI003703F17C
MGRQSRSAGSLAFFLSVQSIGRDCGIMIVPVAMSGAMSVPMPEKVHGEHAEGEYDPNPIVTKPSHHATPLQYRSWDRFDRVRQIAKATSRPSGMLATTASSKSSRARRD